MLTTSKKLLLITSVSLASTLTCAEISTNLGYTSEYYFRGIYQAESSASAGIDFSQSGFYAGVWGADVGDGLETDVYGGYEFEFAKDFSASVGFTGYYYTGEFDDTYEEINLGLSYKFISIGYSVGTWDGGTDIDDDYDFLQITVEHEGFYGTYGSFGDEADGDYFEFGYGTEIGGFDTSIALILSSEELSDQLDSSDNPTESEALIFTISKSFDL
ncbi:TorF family putative porin [Pleionea sediminis]|uniref:TorF family putative porin n=1 Tax=Pleionea sediminis TaxID=2569479 RepID=UPI0011864934|nr:TorF family putative porin [Pleionea sediminis]